MRGERKLGTAERKLFATCVVNMLNEAQNNALILGDRRVELPKNLIVGPFEQLNVPQKCTVLLQVV